MPGSWAPVIRSSSSWKCPGYGRSKPGLGLFHFTCSFSFSWQYFYCYNYIFFLLQLRWVMKSVSDLLMKLLSRNNFGVLSRKRFLIFWNIDRLKIFQTCKFWFLWLNNSFYLHISHLLHFTISSKEKSLSKLFEIFAAKYPSSWQPNSTLPKSPEHNYKKVAFPPVSYNMFLIPSEISPEETSMFIFKPTSVHYDICIF